MARRVRLWILLGTLGLNAFVAAQAAQAQSEEEFSLDDPESAPPTEQKPPPPPPPPTPEEKEAEATLLSDEQALEEERAPDENFRESTDPYEDPKTGYMFAGAAWRYAVMPSWILEWGLESAPTIGTAGTFFGEFAFRHDGFQVAADLGWVKWGFSGPFQLSGDPDPDTEWLDGDFNLLMATATITWSTSFAPWLSLDYGLEAGLAFIFGDLVRSEAYRKSNGDWARCDTWVGSVDLPETPALANQKVYCAPPLTEDGSTPPPTLASNEADEVGEHYGVKAKRGLFNKGIPNLLPVLGPRVSLRFKPIHQLVLRVDVPLPVFPLGFTGGVAALYGF